MSVNSRSKPKASLRGIFIDPVAIASIGNLINEFYKITGVPVVINTSMNVMGEPIVNTPEEAYQMILKTDMDCLVMGNYLVKK